MRSVGLTSQGASLASSAAPRGAARVARAFGVAVLATVLLTVVLPRPTAIPYGRIPSVLLCVIFVAALVLVSRSQRVHRALNRPRATLGVIVGGLLTSLAVGYGTYYETTWDSKLVELVARHPGSQASDYHIAYMSRYPNNDVYLALARGAMWVNHTWGWGFGTAFLWVNLASLAAAMWGVYLLARCLGSRASANIALLFLIAVIGVSPWIAVPYTDMPALWVPVWAIYLFVRAHRSRGLVPAAGCVVLGGVALAIGYCLKVTPIVGAAAVVIVFLGRVVFERNKRAVAAGLGGLVAVVIGLGIGVVATHTVVSHTADMPRRTPGVSASPWSYPAAGIRAQRTKGGATMFGGYDKYVNTITWGKPTSEQTSLSKAVIHRELVRRGVLGTAEFEMNKLSYNWGDGLLYAYGEGSDVTEHPVHHDRLSRAIQTWNSPSGSLFGGRVDLAQGVWWTLLVLVGVWFLRGAVTYEMGLVLMTLLGIVLFTLIFQGRSRYLIGHVPVLAVAAGAAWDTGLAHIARRRSPQASQ